MEVSRFMNNFAIYKHESEDQGAYHYMFEPTCYRTLCPLPDFVKKKEREQKHEVSANMKQACKSKAIQ